MDKMTCFFESKRIELHSKDGEGHLFILRPFKKGDEKGIAECVSEEYEDSYFKRDFYNKEKIIADAYSEKYQFFVAETDQEIVGMEIFHIYKSDDEDYIEPASQIIKKEYRGYGLSGALVYYTLPLAEKMQPCSLFVHAVTFHSATQHLCEAYGMIPVGFRLGSFRSVNMKNSYERLCEKYSEGIMIKPVRKKNVEIIYVPDEIRDFADIIYQRLGVRYKIAEHDEVYDTTVDCDHKMQDGPKLTIHTDEMQRIVIIRVEREGSGLKERLSEVIASFGDEPDWVIQIWLSVNTPHIYSEYEELKSIGFFFSGLKPLCGKREGLYMQWVGDLKLDMDRYVLTEGFDEIRRNIEKFYSKCM